METHEIRTSIYPLYPQIAAPYRRSSYSFWNTAQSLPPRQPTDLLK